MFDVKDNFLEQKKSQDKNSGNEIAVFIIQVLGSLLMLLGAAFLITWKASQDKNSAFYRVSTNKKLTVCGIALGFLLMLTLYLLKASEPTIYFKAIYALSAVWVLGFTVACAFGIILKGKLLENRIVLEDLKSERPSFNALELLLEDPDKMPIGLSVKTGRPIYIPIRQVLEHSITSGATGQGKTTLLKTQVRHFIRHKRPVIIIDPKGEKRDVDEIRELCKEYGREDDFKLFSLSAPMESFFYDPLSVGDSQQRKSKLLMGLNLNHEYYGALADEYLGTILDAHRTLNKSISIEKLHSYIINPNNFSNLETTLRGLPVTTANESLLSRMAALRKTDHKDLKGLSAQLSSLNAMGIGELLNPGYGKKALDLLDVLQKGQVAYFQMNVNGYAAIAKAIGKLIVQDLRLVSNMIQSGQVEKTFDVAFVAIDELGSFVYLDFADYIKQVRSAGIGLSLFFQGIADVRQISPEFAEQVIGNTASKYIFQQDIKSDVEDWSSMAGTQDTLIESYQTEKSTFFGSQKTGMGNVHAGKTVNVDFDVIKNLSPGQAVFLDKKRHISDLVFVWNGEVTKIQAFKKPAVTTRPSGPNIRQI